MTISGYTSLYSESHYAIIAVFVLLELSKATIFGIVFIVGNKRHKIPLLVLASVLIVISFLGHISFFSNAYHINQAHIKAVSSTIEAINNNDLMQREALNSQIALLKSQLDSNNKELSMLMDNVNAYNKAESRNWVAKTNQKRVRELTEQNNYLNSQIVSLYNSLKSLSVDSVANQKLFNESSEDLSSRNTFAYTASLFGISTDRLSNIINVLLAVVIDTLALVLLWVGGELVERKSRLATSSVNEHIALATITDSDTLDSNIESQPSVVTEIKSSPSITLDNCHSFKFFNVTIDDALKMTDDEFKELKLKASLPLHLAWLRCVETLRMGD